MLLLGPFVIDLVPFARATSRSVTGDNSLTARIYRGSPGKSCETFINAYSQVVLSILEQLWVCIIPELQIRGVAKRKEESFTDR